MKNNRRKPIIFCVFNIIINIMRRYNIMSINIRQTTTPNCEDRIGDYKPDMITYHITEGGYEGTIEWEKNPSSGVSSNFVVSRTGRITQLVPITKSAWANGTTESSTKKYYYGRSTNKHILERKGNANDYTISIENEGFYEIMGGALTDMQLKANIELTQYIREQVKSIYGIDIPIDRDHLIGHCEINPKEKPYCPGDRFQWDKLIYGVKVAAGEIREQLVTVKPINASDIGRAITLVNASLYTSSTITKSAERLNGVYYIYDGKEIDGRYRITNSKEKVAQEPLSINVLGFIDKSVII